MQYLVPKMKDLEITTIDCKAVIHPVDDEQLFVIRGDHGQAGALSATLATLAEIARTAERRRLVF